MANLVIKTEGFGDQVLELKLGINRFGRAHGNDFQIEHATISGRHCEIILNDDEEDVIVRDCGSTNGTFIDGHRVQEGVLRTGQTLHLGDVALLVETTQVRVSIPKFELPWEVPAPPVVLPNGSMLCARHPDTQSTFKCTHCGELLCDACVRRLRRHGGKTLNLCPLCTHPCEPLAIEKKKK